VIQNLEHPFILWIPNHLLAKSVHGF
jgi:hypothetical protein